MKGKMRLYYDEEGDFLEISLGKPTKCHASEVEPGIFLRFDDQTNQVKSIGILDFKKRSKNLKDLTLPINIEMIA
ncbi:MAG: DUF2283 domain-containing protein [Candidatus Nanoarchaeia archaeon]